MGVDQSRQQRAPREIEHQRAIRGRRGADFSDAVAVHEDGQVWLESAAYAAEQRRVAQHDAGRHEAGFPCSWLSVKAESTKNFAPLLAGPWKPQRMLVAMVEVRQMHRAASPASPAITAASSGRFDQFSSARPQRQSRGQPSLAVS